MAVIQTPHGRVVGLIVHKDDQPVAQAVEAAECNSLSQPAADSSLGEEAKATAAKRGREAKK